jgi:hypothetical protein
MVVRANGNRNSDTTDVTDIELINVTQRKRRAVLQQGTAAKVIGKRVFLGAGKTFYIIEGAPVTPGMLKRIEAMRAANKRARSSTNASALVPAVVVPTRVFFLRLCGCCVWFFLVIRRNRCPLCNRMVAGKYARCQYCHMMSG